MKEVKNKILKINIILIPIILLSISLFIIIKPNYKENIINKKEYQENLSTVTWKIGGSYPNRLEQFFENNSIDISNITKIVFFNDNRTISNPNNTLDLSTNSDNSVVGYLKDNILYIKIKENNLLSLNQYSSFVFYGLDKVTEIEGLNLISTSNVTSMYNMFCAMYSLTKLDLSSFDTGNVTDMSEMFFEMHKLTNLNISSFDTSNVTDMSGMFQDTYNLTKLDLSNFNTSNVEDMDDMFSGMYSLTKLDLSNFDTSKVEDMSGMFSEMSSLTDLDLLNFDTRNVTNMTEMFALMNSLTDLDLSSFDTSNVTHMFGMFGNMSSLKILDLSSFDTGNVENMDKMFMSMTFEQVLEEEGISYEDYLNLPEEDKEYFDYLKQMYNGGILETIYVSDKFKTDNVTESNDMFLNAKHLVGGNGTTYDNTKIDKEYARIDKEGAPGYFTYILDKYVEGNYFKIDKQNITVNKIENSLKNIGTIVIMDKNNNEKNQTESLKTSDIIKIITSTTKEYTVIVNGDTNGDGNINISDLTKTISVIKKTIENKPVTDLEKISIDLNNDNSINISDLTKMINILKEILR